MNFIFFKYINIHFSKAQCRMSSMDMNASYRSKKEKMLLYSSNFFSDRPAAAWAIKEVTLRGFRLFGRKYFKFFLQEIYFKLLLALISLSDKHIFFKE